MDNIIKIIEVIMPLLTIVASAIVSALVAKANARNEIEKAKIELQENKNNEFNKMFAKLLTITEQYCSFPCGANKSESIQTTAEFLAIAPNIYSDLLNELNSALNNDNKPKIKELRNQLFNLYLNNKQ